MQTNSQAPNRLGISTPPVIDIELLAIDLSSCSRCLGTLNNIEKAIDIIRPILEVMEAQVNVRKIVVESEEQARQHEFSLSPTVRVNGQDIAFEIAESECDSCTDLCGCDEGTSCRVWRFQGEDSTEAPVGLVVESILHQIFANIREPEGEKPAYSSVPENLRRFFSSISDRQPTESCCSPSEQEDCCEPADESLCCDDSEPDACGCQ